MHSTYSPQRRSLRSLPLHLLTLAAFGPLMSGAALAQESYPYFGLGAGQTRGELNERRIFDSVVTPPPGGFTNYSLSADRRDNGYKAFFGYQMNRYLGVELGYFDLGKQRFTMNTTPAGVLNGEVRVQGANLDLVATVPLTTNLSLLGRAGATYARTRGEFTSSGAVTTGSARPSERGGNPKLGLGLQYAFSDNFIVRGEAEAYRVNDTSGGRSRVNMYSVSLVFPFGRAPAPAPRVAYVAPTVAPAPMPEPVMVVQAPPPPVVVMVPAPPPPVVVPRRVSYASEAMFGFDATVVRPEGRTALDAFASELSGTSYSNIVVEGHTDRLGSTAYNEKLSMQRAEAVKDYLVRNGRVDPSKISAVAMGETSPVTQPQDCKGNTKNAALIACLQPDRRVEIEVSGTR
jgi:OOP family OmpA-OmpF porin